MKVEVHLYGDLKEKYLPAGNVTIEIEQGSTTQNLVQGLKMPVDEIVVALVDGRAQKLAFILKDGNRIDLFPILKGG
jgi:molybdopterin converting factor small subunit